MSDTDLRGSQVPTICVAPPGVDSAGQEAVDLAAMAGLHLDPWQQHILKLALAEQANGTWSSFQVALLVPRQNGKSALLEARILAGLFLFGERLIAYSAHEFKTSGEVFRRVLGLIEGTPTLIKRVHSVSRTRGEEGLELKSGQRLRFLARSTGSGRGFSFDTLLWDECQNLPDANVDAQLPAMSARPNPQLWLTGSAPDKDLAPCDHVGRLRRSAMSGKSSKLAFFEWSAVLCTDMCPNGCTDHDRPDDPATWAKTNPGMGIRVSQEHIAREFAAMGRRGFARERLGVGNYPDEGGGWTVISEAAWRAVEDPQSTPGEAVVFAIDVTPEQSHASIAVAGMRPDGLMHVELVDNRPGTAWVVDRMKDLIARWKPAAIVLDAGGPAGSLAADFAAAGIELELPKTREIGAAFGSLYAAVVRPPEAPDTWAASVRIRPNVALTAAVAGAAKRPLGDAFAWNRRAVSVDISPLVAVTLAAWGLEARPPEPPPPPPATVNTAAVTNDFFRPRERLTL